MAQAFYEENRPELFIKKIKIERQCLFRIRVGNELSYSHQKCRKTLVYKSTKVQTYKSTEAKKQNGRSREIRYIGTETFGKAKTLAICF